MGLATGRAAAVGTRALPGDAPAPADRARGGLDRREPELRGALGPARALARELARNRRDRPLLRAGAPDLAAADGRARVGKTRVQASARAALLPCRARHRARRAGSRPRLDGAERLAGPVPP